MTTVLEHTDPLWRTDVARVISRLASTGMAFTAEDVRQFVTTEPHHVNAWGAAFQEASKAGVIIEAGYRRSRAKSRKGGLVAVWRGAR